MKVIEGFHINRIKRGSKKGQEYINYNARYVWRIPERLEGEIDKGDIVWVNSKRYDKYIKARVLVVSVLESQERPLRSVIKVSTKCKKND